MKIETSFRVGKDPVERLKNAENCANELSNVICPLHNCKASVQVTLDSSNELKWAINGACCNDLKRELAEAINDIHEIIRNEE